MRHYPRYLLAPKTLTLLDKCNRCAHATSLLLKSFSEDQSAVFNNCYFFKERAEQGEEEVDDTLRAIGEYMKGHPEDMVQDNDKGVERVEKGNYAFFMESTSIEYTIQRRCNLTSVGSRLDEKGYGIAMRKSRKTPRSSQFIIGVSCRFELQKYTLNRHTQAAGNGEDRRAEKEVVGGTPWRRSVSGKYKVN